MTFVKSCVGRHEPLDGTYDCCLMQLWDMHYSTFVFDSMQNNATDLSMQQWHLSIHACNRSTTCILLKSRLGRGTSWWLHLTNFVAIMPDDRPGIRYVAKDAGRHDNGHVTNCRTKRQRDCKTDDEEKAAHTSRSSSPIPLPFSLPVRWGRLAWQQPSAGLQYRPQQQCHTGSAIVVAAFSSASMLSPSVSHSLFTTSSSFPSKPKLAGNSENQWVLKISDGWPLEDGATTVVVMVLLSVCVAGIRWFSELQFMRSLIVCNGSFTGTVLMRAGEFGSGACCWSWDPSTDASVRRWLLSTSSSSNAAAGAKAICVVTGCRVTSSPIRRWIWRLCRLISEKRKE